MKEYYVFLQKALLLLLTCGGLARGKQQCTPLVSPLPAAPTTPSVTSPPSCPSDTSTLLATLLVSVLLSVLDTPTAEQKGAEKTLIPMGQTLQLDQKI